MTSGFGAPTTGSVETQALRAINSREQSFVNKDFVRNISWLNNSVDTLSQYTQLLQKGVDKANQNVIEQIQGFAADLFVLLAGGEPTGIDLGDLKYVLQGIGALLGINPDTPFPMNLIEAAGNLLEQFLIPLPQFTDIIFDSIALWAEDLGLSQAFIDSLQELNDAIQGLATTVGDFFGNIGELLSVFGLDFSWLGGIWDLVSGIFDGLSFSLKPIFEALSYIAVPVIDALTWVVELVTAVLNPLANIGGGQVDEEGQNAIPPVSDKTTVWSVGSNQATLWVHDGLEKAFRTTGNATAKRVLQQQGLAVQPGKVLKLGGNMKWSGIPGASQGLKIVAVFFMDLNEVGSLTVDIPAGHPASSTGYQAVEREITVPNNVNIVKVGAVVDTSLTMGTVWVKDLSLKTKGAVKLSLIDGLVEFLQALVPWNFFDNIIGMVGAGISDILEWFGGLFKRGEPVNAEDLYGTPNPSLFDTIPLGAISDFKTNYLANPFFLDADAIAANPEWLQDTTKSYNDTGASAKIVADGFEHTMSSNGMTVRPKQKCEFAVYATWETVTGTGPWIQLVAEASYKGEVVKETILDSESPTTGTLNGWVELEGEYKVPDDDELMVDEIRLQLRILSSGTAGTVWFSNGWMSKGAVPRIAPLDWIQDLPESLQGIDEFVQGVIDTMIEIIDGIPLFGGTLGDLFEKVWDWFEDTLATAAQAADALLHGLGLSKLFTRVFGVTEAAGLAETEEAVLALNGRIVALEGGGNVITWTIGGIWNNPTPTEHNLITFVCVNGGDGGDKGGLAIEETAKGGLSGGYIQRSFYTDELPATVAITVGAGGAGYSVSGTGGGPGGAGAVSSFGTLLVGLKGVGAVFKPGGAIPYDTGVAPGNGGNGAFLNELTGNNSWRVWAGATHGTGGPFAPGGRAGFGNLTVEAAGKPGAAAPANIPSGGGGGGGGSNTTQSFQNSGAGGNGGFPGGGGGGGARDQGAVSASYRNGGNGAAGCLYEIRHWEQ